MGVPTKLFIGNVPSSCHQDELRQLFEQFGTVTECDIIKDYAFVHFEKAEDADTAVETMHETDFQGNVLRVQHSKSSSRHRDMDSHGGGGGGGGGGVCHHCGTHDSCGPKPGTKLFIGRLPDGTKSSDLRTIFEAYGTVTECEVIKDYAFVHYESRSQARAALEALDEHDFNGSRIHVRQAKSTGEKTREMERERERGRSWGAGRYDPYDPYGYRGGYGDYDYDRRRDRDRGSSSSSSRSRTYSGGTGKPGTKLFVGNLPDDCTNSELRTLFEPYGQITECEIIKDFAFVHFLKAEEAEMALADLNDTDFGGKTIRVKHSKSGGERSRPDPDGGTADLVRRGVKLFVGNLPRCVDEPRLQRLFSRYGPLTECQIIKDYAFVHFTQKEHADMALADLNDTEFYGNQIRVKRAQSTGGSADRMGMAPLPPPPPPAASPYGYGDPYMDSMYSSRYGQTSMASASRFRPYDIPGDRRRATTTPVTSQTGADPYFDEFLARDPYYTGSSQERVVRPRV